MNHTCLVLPFPPTVNNLFLNVPKRGRVPSKKYVEWQAEAGRVLRMQRPLPHHTDPVQIVMTAGRPDKRRRDISNLIKAPEDLLVKFAVIEDDSLVEDMRIRWDRTGEVNGIQIDIYPMEAA